MKEDRKFKLFNLDRNSLGVDRDDVDGPPNLKTFFRKYKRKFSRLLSVNIFMVLGNFPLFFAGMAYAGYGGIHTTSPSSPIFPVLATVQAFDPSPITAALMTHFGIQAPLTAYSVWSYVLYGLSLLTLLTWGPVSVGTTYILRNLCKGDPVFMWSDFWYAVKRNWKQAIPLGILDIVFSFLLIFNIRYYLAIMGASMLNTVFFYLTVVMALLYFFMRFYMYILLVTFDLSIFKILKNSLIFALIGAKRNFMALLGIIALALVNLAVFYSPLQALGVVLPLVLTLSNGAFMSTYAAYFKIKEIMIDPYYKDDSPGAEPIEETDN